MRNFLLLVFIIIQLKGFTQITVQGNILDNKGKGIYNVVICEIGATNVTCSDIDGWFSIKTIQDTCSISFAIGVETKVLSFTKDTTINITIELKDYYNTRLLTFGANYDLFNSVFGFQISNGVDEQPTIHFECFQDHLLIKLFGQTDFGKNYSYGTEIGWSSFRYLQRISLIYSEYHYEEKSFYFKDLNISSKIGYFGNNLIQFKLGYHRLLQKNSFGITLGVERMFKRNFYFGILSGYYFQYFHHSAYFQFRCSHFNFRTTFDRIEDYDLFTLGLHYSFVRNKNK
jgi:hypothetical protein